MVSGSGGGWLAMGVCDGISWICEVGEGCGRLQDWSRIEMVKRRQNNRGEGLSTDFGNGLNGATDLGNGLNGATDFENGLLRMGDKYDLAWRRGGNGRGRCAGGGRKYEMRRGFRRDMIRGEGYKS
jgi:hypothetical protein